MYPHHASETPDPDPQQHHAPELELQLLKAGVRKMSAQRSECARCRRALLVGERFQVFATTEGERQICELCLVDAEGSLGEPVRTERVRVRERPLGVRRAA
jgi:hypothetical protein